MNGPGDVVAGLAPPQDNAPAVAFARQRSLPAGDEDATSPDGAEAEPAFAGNALAGYIRNAWARNKRARDLIENRLLAGLRARRGVYAQAEMGEMWTADAGEPIYLPLAAAKMRAAEACLRDLLLPDGERPWGLEPSPLPELPADAEEPIRQRAAAAARQQMLEARARQGRVMNLGELRGIAAGIEAGLKDQALAALRQQAKLRTSRMEAQIELRMERGGYYKAVAEFIQHFCTYPAAVLKGPFLRRGRRLSWEAAQVAAYPSPGPSRRGRGTDEPGEVETGKPLSSELSSAPETALAPGPSPAGGTALSPNPSPAGGRAGFFEPRVVAEAEPAWVAVNPFDCYPAPEAESCQEGDFIERIRMTRADLYACIGTPGYDEAAIRKVLADHGSGALRAWLWSDAERRMLEGATHDVWIPEHLVDALHFWGSVEGRTLIDYGLCAGVDDPLAYYEVDAVLIGAEVIRCEINDDPLGRRPYHNASYDPVPGAFWGNSIYELMKDCQAMVNACARALNANLGLASGPMMGIDVAQLAAGQDPKALRPLQVIQLDRSRAQAAASPIEWYQADSRATELLAIIDRFEQKADDLTGIPKYSEGAAQASGAGATFGGLSMLMGQTGELSPLEKLLSSLPPLPQEELDRQERAVVRLRERLLSIPYYAERDRKDGLNFFRNFHSGQVLSDG